MGEKRGEEMDPRGKEGSATKPVLTGPERGR